MDKFTHHTDQEIREHPHGGTEKVNPPAGVRHANRSKIAATSLAVSVAVSNLLGHAIPADAAKPRHHATHGPMKTPHKPRMKYQNFINSSTKLEIIEGSKLTALQGTQEIAEKYNPLKKSDMPEIQDQCEFYDAWHSGIPLVKIRPGDLEKRLSPHFKVKDFVRIDPNWLHVVKAGGYQKYDGEYYRTIARIDPKLISTIEEIVVTMERNANKGRKKKPRIKINLHVDEAYRPYGENARTYVWMNEHRKPGEPEESHPHSRHISGRAVDIDKIPGLEEVADRVLKTRGTGGIGKHGASIVHVDCRPEPYTGGWDYNKPKNGSNSGATRAQTNRHVSKGTSMLSTDTPHARNQLKHYDRIEQLIDEGVISDSFARGYLYYGISDEKLWEKKMRLIGDKRYAWEVEVDKFEQKKIQFERRHPKTKIPEPLEKKLNRARAKLENFTNQYVAAEGARKNVLKRGGPNYAKTDYRQMIKRSLDTWVPKLAATNFKPYMAYLNDPDIYHALHVQEIIPSRFANEKKQRVKFSDSARVHLYHLLTLYRDPTKLPAVHDPVASFGIGQTTFSTYEGLLKQDGAEVFKLPDFERCTGFDCQMRRDILNTANNLRRLDKNVFEKHPHLRQLLEKAPLHEQRLFLSALIGAMHNGGPNVMATAEVLLGKKLDTVKTLTEAGNLLLQKLIKPSVRYYGNHVHDIYRSLTEPDKKTAVAPSTEAQEAPKKKSIKGIAISTLKKIKDTLSRKVIKPLLR